MFDMFTSSSSSSSSSRRRPSAEDDPHNLSRFVTQHQSYYSGALKELRAGRKSSCWSWYLLPTPPFIRNGVEVGSGINRMYALRTDDEARAYLTFRHPDVDLRKNYHDMMIIVAEQLTKGVSPTRLMGIDVPRLKASVAYFESLARGGGDAELHAICCKVMQELEMPAEARAAESESDDEPAADVDLAPAPKRCAVAAAALAKPAAVEPLPVDKAKSGEESETEP
tara:strand:- start:1601 stop:2275 length:675 start_codon:yes stop_codon:yes gene_type:complete